MRHRNDIDGLRAVAVIPIVLFHAGLSQLAGGFVGVDIFFVISGFLITTIISREMDQHQFTIAKFYHRRVVRIFPALTVMLAIVVLSGIFFLLPVELQKLSSSAAAAMAFLSNMYFWKDADYFAGASEAKPLLHTWSLGVEEQFYLFYPMLLLGLKRYMPRRAEQAILAITILSFLASLALTFKEPTSAFYLLPTRAWELGIGALVAMRRFPALPTAAARNAASVAGLVLILVAIAVTSPDWGFPAPMGLLPCLGAALLIAYGEHAPTARLLGSGAMRWIGAISYSLYLWHWPIITYYRLRFGMHLDLSASVLLIALSVLAGALSYYLVEQPFLRNFRRGAPKWSLAAGAAAILGIAGSSLLVSAEANALVRLPPDVQRVAAYAEYRNIPDYNYQFRKGPCFIGEGMAFDRQGCLAMKPGKVNVILLGDSHAAQYWRALSDRFPNYNFMQATASGCRPTKALDGLPRCTEIVDFVLRKSALRPGIAGIVLGGRWEPQDVDSLADTVRDLRKHGLPVTVIGPTVEYDGELPQLLARAMLQGKPANVLQFRLAAREALDRRMKPVIQAAGARYVSEAELECPGGQCAIFDADHGPFHFDYGHLTLVASKQIVNGMGTVF